MQLLSTGHRLADRISGRGVARNPPLRTYQLGRICRNRSPRPRGSGAGQRSDPVPYGTPFSATLSRFAQDPRKSWPTGHRLADRISGRGVARNPPLRTYQLGRICRNRSPRPRGSGAGQRSDPVPYGTPFSATLSRFAQDPRKSWPTGHRPADPIDASRAAWPCGGDLTPWV